MYFMSFSPFESRTIRALSWGSRSMRRVLDMPVDDVEEICEARFGVVRARLWAAAPVSADSDGTALTGRVRVQGGEPKSNLLKTLDC
jgi:hypothetical protein